MSTLVICYSLTGNTRQVAREVARDADAAFGEIRDVKGRGGFFGYMRSGFESMTGRTPEIYEPASNPGEYDRVILALPLWAGSIAAPMRTYLSRQGKKISRYAVAITHGGSSVDKAVGQIAGLVGRPAIEVLHVRADAVKDGSYKAAVAEFCKSLSAVG